MESSGEMMAFDFDNSPDRRGTDSAKWATFGPDVLAMWVADMDFASPPAIEEALQERTVAHGVFGYGRDNGKLRAAVVERIARLYEWSIEPDGIVMSAGACQRAQRRQPRRRKQATAWSCTLRSTARFRARRSTRGARCRLRP